MTTLFLNAAAVLAMSMQPQAATAEAEAPSAPEPAAAPAPAPQEAPEPEKITDRSHPDYVRCRRDPVIGSRAKFVRRCYTNREWEMIAQVGNSGSRRLIESQQGGLSGQGGILMGTGVNDGPGGM